MLTFNIVGGVLTISNGGTGRFRFPSGKRRVVTALGLFFLDVE
jgi:hypothetical protein